MFVIRPVAKNDLDDLLTLSKQAGVGLTTLPQDDVILKQKIKDSIDSFGNKQQDFRQGNYFFVLEDVAKQKVVGTSAIIASVGGQVPFYSYKLSTLFKSCDELELQKEFKILQLVNDYQTCTELCTLFLAPKYRRDGNGSLLSRCRFLFMTEFKIRFSETIFAEMRGMSDDTGHSPFWHHLGKHFFGIDFSHADFLTSVSNKQFISDLMPRYPIYLDLLPKVAQRVVGKVHRDTRPAVKMLNHEGLYFKNYVDIFDAGPTLEAHLNQIRTVRKSKRLLIKAIGSDIADKSYLVANTSLNFRACYAPLHKDDKSVQITPELAQVLQVGVGDYIRVVAR